MGKRKRASPLLAGLLEMTAGEPVARQALARAVTLGAKLRMGERAVALFALSLIEAARRAGPRPA
ncbi:hypothetical protein [Plastoroseomonas arctica]|uniref:Uncharacterized protein n=1 Tax=Plastoroseomonas arctica TaxID=1509237 RepID=A0AAF1KMV3_9PROT|nr:hypothetical protein [Plastoroseomonas arctica]MBR0655964.1 hypothetical protein [Plastoroseomonas arctica]